MLFNRDPSWIPRRFWGQLFEASASGIWLLAVQNTVPEMLSIGPILSVGLCVCVFVQLFPAHFLDQFWTEFIPIFRKKITQKRELEPNSVGEADHFHATFAEVVALSSSGDCGATFPPRPNWWRRS